MRSTIRSLALAVALALGAWADSAHAQHVVFLDFGNFGLGGFATVNGNSPPTNADVTAVRDQIFANMSEDFARFDVHLVRFAPNEGRFTRLRILGNAPAGGLFGCAGPSCCAFNTCSGIDTWRNPQSSAEIYVGNIATLNSLQNANATTARIARAVSHTASHELGHVLGLFHCHAADDFVASGQACSDGFNGTGDANVNFHIMASGASSGLTAAQRATRDRFFSVRSSRRELYRDFQPRNHWAPLANVNAGSNLADLTYGIMSSAFTVRWANRLSSGSSFGGFVEWSPDAGERGMLSFVADVTGDRRADLVLGRPQSGRTMRWEVKRSNGSSFGATEVWRTDGGDLGDRYRLADVTGDGRADLIYGEPRSDGTLRWFVRASNGSSFGGQQTFITQAGVENDLFLVGDVTADGRADLVAISRGVVGGVTVWRSTGNGFTLAGADPLLFGFEPDYVYLGDINNDGDDDLVLGRVESDTRVRWTVKRSNRCTGFGFPNPTCFPGESTFISDAGSAGELFRIGDGDGDGRVDLFRARPVGRDSRTSAPTLTTVRWFRRPSTGSTFGGQTTWRNDAGDEGDVFP